MSHLKSVCNLKLKGKVYSKSFFPNWLFASLNLKIKVRTKLAASQELQFLIVKPSTRFKTATKEMPYDFKDAIFIKI